MPQRTAKTNPRKIQIIVAVLVVFAVVGAFALSRKDSNKQPSPANTNQGVNLNPATETEKKESNQLKEQSATNPQTPPANSGDKKNVTPVIVDASQYDDKIEVRAYVPAVVEDSGSCTITFTKGSQKITKTTAGLANVSTTQCATLDVSRGEFSSGTWQVVVSYSSTSASGSSQPGSVEVK